MNLDLRTMMVMIAVLSFLFSVLLAVASLHARGIRGLRHWALASLFISLGAGIAYTQTAPGAHWPVITGAVLLGAGAALQLLGIQAFKTQPDYRYLVLFSIVGLVAGISIWFTLIDPNVQLRATFNSIIFAGVNFACARALLIPIKSYERTAHWLTGSSFAILAVVYSIRAATIYFSPADQYGLLNPIPINPVMFFTASVTQLFLTFGFVLMVNYRMASELENLATTDALTGAWNRRSLDQECQRLLLSSARRQEVLSVMMLDVDHFKSINDAHGHQAGDEVLRQLINTAKTEIRSDDYLARYGGEEFCLLLPNTSEQDAHNLAERLRLLHANHPAQWREKAIASTISIGIASSDHIGLNFSLLLQAADMALYRAKLTGRNRVVAFSHLPPENLEI